MPWVIVAHAGVLLFQTHLGIAKGAVGLTMDQIPNNITLETPASFEPSIDYIVTKARQRTCIRPSCLRACIML